MASRGTTGAGLRRQGRKGHMGLHCFPAQPTPDRRGPAVERGMGHEQFQHQTYTQIHGQEIQHRKEMAHKEQAWRDRRISVSTQRRQPQEQRHTATCGPGRDHRHKDNLQRGSYQRTVRGQRWHVPALWLVARQILWPHRARQRHRTDEGMDTADGWQR